MPWRTCARAFLARESIWAACPSPPLQVEPELLHLLVLLDVRRSGAAASDKGTAAATVQGSTPPVLRCSVADADAVPSPWERKAEAWRKAVTAALRPLHKELQALEASGALLGYKASRLEQLQSDAAMLICNLQVSGAVHRVCSMRAGRVHRRKHGLAVGAVVGLPQAAAAACPHLAPTPAPCSPLLQGVGAEGASQDCGVGLFPAAAAFNHSCRPTCHTVTMGETQRRRCSTAWLDIMRLAAGARWMAHSQCLAAALVAAQRADICPPSPPLGCRPDNVRADNCGCACRRAADHLPRAGVRPALSAPGRAAAGVTLLPCGRCMPARSEWCHGVPRRCLLRRARTHRAPACPTRCRSAASAARASAAPSRCTPAPTATSRACGACSAPPTCWWR